MKLRMNRELHERARACADAIDEPLCEFVRLAIICMKKGRLDSVALDKNLLSATRAASVPVEVGPIDIDAPKAREALAKAVVYAEERNPKPYTPPLREGIDYIVAPVEA